MLLNISTEILSEINFALWDDDVITIKLITRFRKSLISKNYVPKELRLVMPYLMVPRTFGVVVRSYRVPFWSWYDSLFCGFISVMGSWMLHRTIYDLIQLIEVTSVWAETYRNDFRRSRAFYWCVCFCQKISTAKARIMTNQTDGSSTTTWQKERKKERMRENTYRKFGYRNTELYRHYVRFDCSIAHSKALGDWNRLV